MFSRSILRSAAPLRRQTRAYSPGHIETPAFTGRFILGAIGIGVGGSIGYTVYADYLAPRKPDTVVEEIQAKPKDVPQTFVGGDQGFIDLKLAEVSDVNHNVKRFRFELPDKDAVSGLTVTSALVTRFKSDDMEKPVIRPYTPISDEGERGYLDLMIKRYPNGPMSEHIHSMAPGQRLDFRGPIPKYPWFANKHSHVALIAGGTGITPMYQLTRGIFNNPDDKTKVTLISANLTEEDILLKKELEQLENEYPDRFRVFYTVDKPPASWPYGKGHVTKKLLQKVIPGPREDNIKVFVCGPPGMYKAVSGVKKSPSDQGELDGILKELGYTKEQVYKF